MWTLPSCARRVIRARSVHADGIEYPARTSLVSPLHTGVVSRHARPTLTEMLIIKCLFTHNYTSTMVLVLIAVLDKTKFIQQNR